MISGYVVEEELKRSTRSIVYRAIDENTLKPVVLKHFPNRTREACSPNFELLRNLSNLHIPSIKAVKEFEGTVFIFEYIAGVDLDGLLKVGIDVPLFKSIASDISVGLTELHKNGLVHGDISPSNILIGPDNKASIIDIEGATKVGSESYSIDETTFLMTQEYASPEQFIGSPLDQRSDIYSFGCLLFKILTGRSPFFESSRDYYKERHLYDPVPRLPMHVSSLQHIIDRCLEKEKDDRYQTIDQVLTDVFAVSEAYEVGDIVLKSSLISTEEIKAIQGEALLGAGESLRLDPKRRLSVEKQRFRFPLVASFLVFLSLVLITTSFFRPDVIEKIGQSISLQDNSELESRWNVAQSLSEDSNQSPISIIAGYRRVLEVDPSHAGALSEISQLTSNWVEEIKLALRNGDVVRAQSKLSESVIALPEEKKVWDELGKEIESHGHVLRLLSSTRKLLEAHGLSDIPTATLAIQAYQEALRVAPDYSVAADELNKLALHYAELAETAAIEGQLDNAINFLERAITANPGLPELSGVRETIQQATTLQSAIQELLSLASSYRQTDALVSPVGANAAELYHRVLAADPNNVIAIQALDEIVSQLLMKTNDLLNEGDLQGATTIVERSVAAGLDSSVVNSMKSNVEAEIRRRDRIVFLIERAKVLLASGYITEPQNENVVSVAREIARIDPGNTIAEEMLDRAADILVQVAEEAYAFNLWEDAKYYLELALTVKPNSQAGRDLLINWNINS